MLTSRMAPDAAQRDANNRELAGADDHILRGEDITFVTQHVSDEEKAAVIAVLLAKRESETSRVRLVERRDHEPWARSQRTPEGIGDFLSGGSS